MCILQELSINLFYMVVRASIVIIIITNVNMECAAIKQRIPSGGGEHASSRSGTARYVLLYWASM